MSIKIYDECITVTNELNTQLKRIFVNHMLVYNHCLDTLHSNHLISFQNLKKVANSYIVEKNLNPIITSAMFIELYYQVRKFRKNVKIKKQLTDVHYLTFILYSYNDASFSYNHSTKEIKIKGLNDLILLDNPLPVFPEQGPVYVNVSYSCREDKFKINICV